MKPNRPAPSSPATTHPEFDRTLMYELLDAHVDTLLLASDLEYDPAWAGHLAYLRDLQRAGRELMALRD